MSLLLSSHLYHTLPYASLLQQLSQLLQTLSPLWRLRSFDCRQLPWQTAFPNLADVVLQLDEDALAKTDACQQQLLHRLWPALHQDLVAQGLSVEQLDNLAQLLALTLPQSGSHTSQTHQVSRQDNQHGLDEQLRPHFSAHIKGRKWQQITSFAAALPSETTRGLLLEWCAGKGHLGRLICQSRQVPVVSLEWQQALCRDGQDFAHRWQLPQQFICADAFAPPAQVMDGVQHAVALHACGELHTSLLTRAAASSVAHISISPCCYHLIRTEFYQPLSKVAQQHDLQLNRQELQLPLQQSVVSSSRDCERRQQEMIWRLGFDSLQRVVRQQDNYLPLPAVRNAQLSGSFAEYCQTVAAFKQLPLTLPDGTEVTDFTPWLQAGAARLTLVRQLDLVAHLLRAPLEHYLLLDRLCFLIEQGYQTEISCFCDTSVTPRNALIQASLPQTV
ncbi:methyltransferase [Shewanella sp. NFH-SH190041]|uniref:SAM-dependent methyltransferase n=1 Tax=Shewanella sp. NFH-SH190041 TaxID=2950245 RepID=UPI0021C3B240|nr:SAM-dependent methyltransferase [Shewanella sp. NFH-SH190041]BDM65077.1 methyltransferase [Shewanella sp. NFH-SH190041]